MQRIAGDGVNLAVLVEGEGRPVFLLHGFPDSSHVWRHQVPALVAAGMRAVAPDLRGFGESDKPEPVEDYAITRSVADMVAVMDELGIDRADVVGHDWGAGLAWCLAAFVPERVNRLVVMSVGHPNTLHNQTIEQREKAWYQLLFQFTDVAEELLSRDDWKLFREWSRGDGDLERYVADLSRSGALTAGLNWYRASANPRTELGRGRPFPSVSASTLGLWSSRDNYVTEDGMLRSEDHVTGAWRYERIEGASHWLQLDAPEKVNELLIEFLSITE
jgi:pimeloyl-ACP methyl ester carboxylesterase